MTLTQCDKSTMPDAACNGHCQELHACVADYGRPRHELATSPQRSCRERHNCRATPEVNFPSSQSLCVAIYSIKKTNTERMGGSRFRGVLGLYCVLDEQPLAAVLSCLLRLTKLKRLLTLCESATRMRSDPHQSAVQTTTRQTKAEDRLQITTHKLCSGSPKLNALHRKFAAY